MEYGCIGEKLGHSFSKIIHNEFCDYKYELKELSFDELDSFLKNPEFKAINVTVPYKQAVIPYLHNIDDAAKDIGAVNTIVNCDGKLYGYNTDFYGLNCLIERLNVSLENKRVLILGSGGTSKTAFAVSKAKKAAEIYTVSRKSGVGLISYSDAITLHKNADIIINTTPCGMYPDIDNSALDVNDFSNLEAVIDVVYNPLNSQLVVDAKNKGIKACGGLYMLISQAVLAIEKFIGKKIDLEEAECVYKKLLNNKRNLVLIGMPSCGKTSIGKKISGILDKEFIDTDQEIVKIAGISIPEIFKNFGEEYFRKLETEVIEKVSAKQNAVIATGGGAVLNTKNINLLKGNGTVVFLDRPLEKLISTDDRPLSANKESLIKRFAERYDIYLSSADAVIKNDDDIENALEKVKEVFLYENFGY